MKKFKWHYFLVLIFFSPALFANCKQVSFLKGGFDLNAYQQCTQLLKTCPKTGLSADRNCVNDIAKKTPACRQLFQFADEINAELNSLSASADGSYTIIDQTFIADGQHLYYILSPFGCYLNATGDPRRLDKLLSKKFKNTVLMVANVGNPISQALPNGGKRFTVLLKVTKNCMACELLGYAKLQFDFNLKGQLLKTKLISFQNTAS